MLTLLSTIASFLTGGLPKILDMLQDRGDKKQEIELLRLQMEREAKMAEFGLIAQAKIEEIRAAVDMAQAQASEKVALYQHDSDIGQGISNWVANLRASVRPVITYAMFLMLCGINVYGCWYATQQGVPFIDALNLLWDDETQTLFASIIAFWFGSQAFGRR